MSADANEKEVEDVLSFVEQVESSRRGLRSHGVKEQTESDSGDVCLPSVFSGEEIDIAVVVSDIQKVCGRLDKLEQLVLKLAKQVDKIRVPDLSEMEGSFGTVLQRELKGVNRRFSREIASLANFVEKVSLDVLASLHPAETVEQPPIVQEVADIKKQRRNSYNRERSRRHHKIQSERSGGKDIEYRRDKGSHVSGEQRRRPSKDKDNVNSVIAEAGRKFVKYVRGDI